MYVLHDADCSGSSCDETGRMVVPYGEARALLSGGEQDYDWHIVIFIIITPLRILMFNIIVEVGWTMIDIVIVIIIKP